MRWMCFQGSVPAGYAPVAIRLSTPRLQVFTQLESLPEMHRQTTPRSGACFGVTCRTANAHPSHPPLLFALLATGFAFHLPPRLPLTFLGLLDLLAANSCHVWTSWLLFCLVCQTFRRSHQASPIPCSFTASKAILVRAHHQFRYSVMICLPHGQIVTEACHGTLIYV